MEQKACSVVLPTLNGAAQMMCRPSPIYSAVPLLLKREMQAKGERELLLPKAQEIRWVEVQSHSKPQQTLKRFGLILAIGLVVGFITLILSGYFKATVARIILASQSATDSSHVDITIPQGLLRGYTNLSRESREYFGFLKVPYAAPPLGHLRFKDPVEAQSWSGLRDNDQVAPQCIQPRGSDVVGEEDCLYANIYTPSLPKQATTDKLLPVMVYVHGGMVFNAGNASQYGAKYFMDEDVVLVTFQFRLGSFGFLSTGDHVIRGNMGAKDQIQLLKWVQSNIKYFNGDPNLVTIFGMSSGGMFVGELMLSPMSQGLFHRAISQSGASLYLFNLLPNGITPSVQRGTMEELGQVLGCPVGDSQAYWECLLEKDAKDIAKVKASQLLVHGFSEENWDDPDDPPGSKFIAGGLKHECLLEDGRCDLMKVPYMIGNVNAESYGIAAKILQDANQTKVLNDRFEEVLGQLISLTFDDPLQLEKIKNFYFPSRKILNDTGSLKGLGDLISDRQFNHPCYIAARSHAKFDKTYLYWLTKPPKKSYIEKAVPDFPFKAMGLVHHADELQYHFFYRGYPEISVDDEEYLPFSKLLVQLWVQFARDGYSLTLDMHPGNFSNNGVSWVTVNEVGNGSANSTVWLELNDHPRLTTEPRERMRFWDQFDYADLRYHWK